MRHTSAQPAQGSGDKTRNPPLRTICKVIQLSDMNKVIPVAVGALMGGGIAVASVPVFLGVVGFTKVGIATGSMAAKMMSAAAVANGGGVASGSLVAVLQSVGASGLSTMASTALGSAGSTLGSILAYWGSQK
ncbi:interferon alpha-inducible protein 27-like protein 2A [Trichosurus vulpecula]|uniref:interferon alpha-inducible protein 27-like protein 2A n=1 Tax=Trichosurus vulpecula TaxID=9337 RepID=UPI00186B49FC|nr:interferon alpha-inducible protein 27-like protein 2A [Trichosurus vulpecula]